MHPLSWFQERRDKTIKRIRTSQYGDVVSYKHLKDDRWITQCFETQADDLRYEDNHPKSHGYKDPFTDDTPVVRVHQSKPDSTCISCEG